MPGGAPGGISGASPVGSRGGGVIQVNRAPDEVIENHRKMSTGKDYGSQAQAGAPRVNAPYTGPPTAWALQQQFPRSANESSRRQQSIGGCSGCSMPSSSPGTVPREPKGSIEVPVEALQVATQQPTDHPKVLQQRMMNDQDIGKVTCETSEDVKLISRLGMETSENVKELNERVGELQLYLKDKALDYDRVATLKCELEQARAQVRSYEYEAREAVSRASHAEARLAQLEQQLQDEADSARSTSIERAEESKITELQKQWRAVTEQAGLFKAQNDNLEKEIDQKNAECAELRAHIDEKNIEIAQLRERYELETAALVQEKRGIESHLGDVNGRYQAFALEQRDLQEQNIQQGRALDAREAQARQCEEELAEQAQELSSRQSALASREQWVGEMESMANDLHQKRLDFEQQRQEMEQQLQRQQDELERQTREQRDRHRKYAETDKETKSLRQTVQEQKKQMFDLESQLHREKTVATFLTPGEYIKMAKKQEGELCAHENAELKRRNANLKTDASLVRWHNEVMKKHLPQSVWEAVRKELDAQPLPPRDLVQDTDP